MKFTEYFLYTKQRPDRVKIKMEWIEETITTLATIMVTFYSQIAYPLVTVFYWAKHNPKEIFDSTLDLCTL